MPVQLSIRDIRVLKIDYSLVPQAVNRPADPEESSEPGEKTIEMKMNFRSEYPAPGKNQSLLKVIQGVQLAGDLIPFSIYVEMGGLFSFDTEPPPDEFDRLRNINCNAILLPYVRELVSEICRRGGLSPIYLPPVNFVQLHKDGVFKHGQHNQEGQNTKA